MGFRSRYNDVGGFTLFQAFLSMFDLKVHIGDRESYFPLTEDVNEY